MAVTMQQVREVLDPEEPNYQRGVALGPEALPHLDALVTSGDPMLASKATYLASLIQDARSTDILEKAAKSHEPIVRVAAAAGASNLAAAGESDVLRALQNDPDPGVRKVAQKGRGRRTTAAAPETPRAQDRGGPSSEKIVFGLMPGEEDTAAVAGQPDQMQPASQMSGGETGLMPGERRGTQAGTMPSEAPKSGGGTGEMPK